MRLVLHFTWIVLLIASSLAEAQKIARDDLARALQRFERAFYAAQLEPESRARIEKAFDQATASFFMGSYSAALESLDDLTCELDPRLGELRSALNLELNAKLEVAERLVAVRVARLYGKRPEGQASLVLEDSGGGVLLRRDVELSEASWTLALPKECDPEQDLFVALTRGDLVGPRHRVEGGPQPYARAEELLSQLPERKLRSLEHTLFVTRCSLLSGPPSPMRSAEFLLAPHAFARELEEEAAVLAQGEHPYRGKTGSWWMALEGVPLRIVAPQGEGPWPLVLALHGMGGDENMFAEAYGEGHLATLASERGFLLVCPSTYSLQRRATSLPRLLEHLEGLYPIDPERRLLVGHSMGCGVVGKLLKEGIGTWSGAILIAGTAPALPSEGVPLPPCVQVHGDLDPLVGSSAVEKRVQGLQTLGHPIQWHLLAGRGHTLLVPEAIDIGLASLGWTK